MMRMLFSLLLCVSAFAANEKKFAIVRPIAGLKEVPLPLQAELKKSALLVIAKRKDVQLLLSGDEPPSSTAIETVAVESVVKKENGSYTIESKLTDLKTQTVLKTRTLSNVRESDLVRLFQASVSALFLGPDDAVPGSDETEEKPLDPKVPKEANPQPRKKIKNPPLTRQIDETEVDFKKRLQDLNADVDEAVAKKKAEEEANNQGESENKNTVANNNSSALGALGAEGDLDPSETDKKKSSQYPRVFQFDVGFEKRTSRSTDLVETITPTTLLLASVLGHNPFSFGKGHWAWSYNLMYGRFVSQPQDIINTTPAPYQAGIFGTWRRNRSENISLGVQQEAMYFFNVPNPGEQKQAASLKVNWLKLMGEKLFSNKYIKGVQFQAALPIGASSSFESLKDAKSWNGMDFRLKLLGPRLVWKLESSIMYEVVTLSTQGIRSFSLNESRLAFSFRYSL